MTAPLIPSVVRQLSGSDSPQLIWTNERGGLTYRAGNRFVKWNPHTTELDLEAERLRLEWAIRWHPVPRVLDWGANDEAQWMVTAALSGEGAVGIERDEERVSFYRFLWENEDKIGIPSDAVR